MRRSLILLSMPVILAGCDASSGTSIDQTASSSSTISIASSSASSSSVDPVSIPALMNYKADGSDFQLGTVLANNSAYTRYTVTYRGDGLKLSGIMNIPRGDGPFPILILNHGFIEPSVYTNGRGLKREQDYLARQGYAVLHPDYRNHAFSDKDPDSDVEMRMGYVKDVMNAIAALKAANLPTIDTTRIGMLGHSMGGGVTLNTIVAQNSLVEAAVFFAPVSGEARVNFDRWLKRRPEVAAKIEELYGSPKTNPEFWNNASAVNFLDQIQTPVMIHHGTADESVPIEWSDDLDMRLKAANKDVTYYTYPNEPHEFIKAWTEVMERTTAFFDEHVKG